MRSHPTRKIRQTLPFQYDNVLKPFWNSQLRELWFGNVLVKQFRRLATEQERVLNAFEKRGWPRRIADPLVHDGTRPKAQRLRETIANLNNRTLTTILRFEADGTGAGVRWTYPYGEDRPKKFNGRASTAQRPRIYRACRHRSRKTGRSAN